MSRSLAALLFALPLSACGGRVDLPEESTGDSGVVTDSGASADTKPVEICGESACGPRPTTPSELCSDGSVGGLTGRCIRVPSGACGWETRQCPPMPGKCVNSSTCASDSYCEVPTGSCGATGSCVKKPDDCDAIYAPVCGCDGTTYGNECAAKLAGATVANVGECSPKPGNCGGSIGSCPSGQFCKFPDGMCPAPGSTGACTKLPGCADIYSPVCGCNGKTFGNSCEAASANQPIAYKGECAEPATTECGDLAPKCPSSMYCDYPAGSVCGADDSAGACRARPTTCTKEYQPVCACDRKTYGNACQAAMAGVDVFRDGPC